MEPHSDHSSVLTFEYARHVVEEQAAKLQAHGKELVAVSRAHGRILAESVFADRPYPPFDRATRDGFALRAGDVAAAPANLHVVGEIQAGASPNDLPMVLPGQAISIMTGAAVPAGADSVVMLEHTAVEGNNCVRVQTAVEAGANIVRCGAEAKQGECLLSSGIKMDYAALGLAASVGKVHVLVYSRPHVAVLATGNELVDLDVPPRVNQIRNSNSYSLSAQIADAGGEPIILPIAPDEPNRIRELVQEALEADLMILSGGVSAGKYDFVESVLAELGAEFLFTGVKIQPGRPLVFGRIPVRTGHSQPKALHKYFFGLPGNPVSTMVTFKLFVGPILAAISGAQPEKLVFSKAKLKSEVQVKTGLRRFLPAVLSGEFDDCEVELIRWQGSGDIAAVARANCFIVVAPDRDTIPAGELVSVMMR